MIDLYQAVFLALLQGLTEFLPVSSSVHLLLPSLVLGWPDQGLAFDVTLHVGTLSAVLLYYRENLVRMANHWLRSLAGAPACDDSRMVWYRALATVPAGLLLGFADRRARHTTAERPLGLAIAVLIGFAQALSLIPGVSRSGITMTAALLLGMSRQSAARFSFYLSIPIIASAGMLKVWELVSGDANVDWLLLELAPRYRDFRLMPA